MIWFWIKIVFGTKLLGMFHYKYCSEWNVKLNELIDKYGTTATVNNHTLVLNNTEVWIANEFYSYGHNYTRPALDQHPMFHNYALRESTFRRPSIFTIYKLNKLVLRKRKEEHMKREDVRIAGIKELS